MVGAAVPDALSRLASNESPYGPLPGVADALQRQLQSVNRYPEVRCATLRATIAGWLGVGVDHVVVGPGSTGLLWQIAAAFLDEDSEMVTPWPSFEGYPLIAQLMGATWRAVPLVDHRVDASDVADAVGDRTKLVVIAEPNNPTGTSIGFDAVNELADATAGRCVLVVDEAYLEFAPSVDARRTVALLDEFPHVVALRTFSKAHGLAGLRVGYAVGAPHVIDPIDRVAPPFSVSSLAQAAAIASIEAVDELGRRVAAVVAERDRVIADVQELVGELPPSATNFVWIPCPDEAESLATALELDGVITRPVAGQGVRVTIGERGDNDRFLRALGAFVGRRVGRAS
jgi:histidinol-phosphate aminotransferase